MFSVVSPCFIDRTPFPVIVFPAAGEIPKWPKGADCKSAGNAFVGSNPALPTNTMGSGLALQYYCHELEKPRINRNGCPVIVEYK